MPECSAAAEYRIVADVAHADARPFPACHDLLWGVPLTSPLCYGLYTSSALEGAPNAVEPGGDPARLVADASGAVRLRLLRVNPLGDQARVIPKLVLRRITPVRRAPLSTRSTHSFVQSLQSCASIAFDACHSFFSCQHTSTRLVGDSHAISVSPLNT